MAFGKPGRPRENREERRYEIYRRVAPQILRHGAAVTARDAAEAALVSVGTFYRYFPSKRELLLYGLRPEAQEFVCRPFGTENEALRRQDPERYLDAFIDHQVAMALFVRPSVRAANDIGLPTLMAAVEATVSHAAVEFAGLFAEFVPGASERDLAALARSVRRSVIGALLDPSVTRRELRATLRALIDGTAVAVGERPQALRSA